MIRLVCNKFCSFIAEIWSRNDAKSTTACVNSSLQAPKLITSLEFLPDEILVEIIDYLNQFDVLALCLANSRFHSLCMNKLFKRVLFINPQWHQILHCRKLNTLTNTNYTILNKFEGIPWDKFKFCMGEEFDTDIYQEGHDYYVRIDDYKEPIHPTDQFNQISYQLLWISLRDISQAYIDRIKNTKIIGLFKKVACSLVDTTVEILDQLQGTFVKVKSLILDEIYAKHKDTCYKNR
ncbi:uncharacterized protein RJT21DRAFT_3604 [Scheffersomyces amazonensis]|uniref:uncharacterized protein n=1 Tax=Scheffersomyces amazonensis TaxID=1078765 RepID=UPI00315C5036